VAPDKAREARAGMAMSLATFAMAAASAIQAVLYLSLFGTSGRTDGFFVAFALYTTFGVFSQSLRLTSVPLMVNGRMSSREFAAALGLIAVPVMLATIPLAGPLAQLLAPGLSGDARSVTESALPVLGAAMTLQLWAAGAATLLAIRAAFGRVAGGYIAGAAAGLITFLALMNSAGELTLGWSMLAMAVVTCGWMLAGIPATGGLEAGTRSFGLLRLVRQCGLILGRTAIYLAFNMLFVITLAFASHSAVGDATVLSYSYLFASYLVAGTGMALGMSRIPDMTRAGRDEKLAVFKDTVPPGFRYSIMLVAPALALLITAGAPLIHLVLPGSLSADGVEAMRTFTALLVPWTVAALLVSFLLPAMFATGRARLVNALAVPVVVVHLVATVVFEAAFGVDGAIAAFAVAPAALAAVLLLTGAGPLAATVGRELAVDGLRFLALAAVAFGAGAVVGAAVPEGFTAALTAAVVGSALYAAGLGLIARRQLSVLAGSLLRPASASA
jgi:hypothetical protein